MKDEACWPVNGIRVGERCRKDMGDIDALAASIADVGLLQPVAVLEDGTLICGERRLLAVKKLGWDQVPAHVVGNLDDTLRRLRAERAENTCRKEFTPLEIVAHGQRLEKLERKAARGRQAAGGKKAGRGRPAIGSDKLSEPIGNGQTREKVAEAFGISGAQYEKMKAVAEAAAKEPKKFGEVARRMDAGEVSVHQAARTVKRRRSLEAAASAAKNGEAPAAAGWEIRRGDCLTELRKLEAGSVALAFADPPYNQGIDYGDGAEADRLKDDEFLCWCGNWVRECARALSPVGSLWVLIGDEYADHMGLILRAAGLHRRAWVKWYETFGVNCASNFNRCSRHLFYCVKDRKRFTFNAAAVNRPSDRQAEYNDPRADPGGKVWDDVWQIPRLTGTAAERLPDFPTQLPLALLRPVVGCSSSPGDLVLDPFNGSGTTGVAAVESGRRYLGIEKQARFVELATMRLRGVCRGEKAG